MSDFTVEAKRVKAGQSLTDINNQAMNAINQLKQIKINIVALKSSVDSEADYTTEDSTAVQAVIDSLLAEIATI